jgi:hypothetical protein
MDNWVIQPELERGLVGGGERRHLPVLDGLGEHGGLSLDLGPRLRQKQDARGLLQHLSAQPTPDDQAGVTNH